jgi:glycosyltransferase involved in cell wall biosynthesis
MRVLHVTPHLPPDQAANALLPAHLGDWARAAGHEVTYVAHPPRAGQAAAVAGEVRWVTPRQGTRLARRLRLSSVTAAREIHRVVAPLLAQTDLVHLHGNGLLTEAVSWVATRHRTPTILTLYGTEIWHYRRKPVLDLFTRMYRRAAQVTFYSRGLYDHAVGLGLTRPGLSVAYPPVVDRFVPVPERERRALRERLGLRRRHVLLNVKRLHPLAGQDVLITALAAVVRQHPDTELVICGTGALRADLEAQAASLGLGEHVTFAGLVDNPVVADYDRAADLFVLPSRLEALPTVAVEALASGTPVVSADHPGGIELNGLFGHDVAIVAREDAPALAASVCAFLARPRRASEDTAATVAREFRPRAVWERYLSVYGNAIAAVPRPG